MQTRTIPQLKDVAKDAGVSLTTASIILRNGSGRFQDDTKQRVFDAARKLGWRRNLLVEGIQTGRSRTVGILVPPFDSYWKDILTGIHRELIGRNYMPITLWTGEAYTRFADRRDDDSVQEGRCLINMLVDRRIEGIITWPDIADDYSGYLHDLLNRNLPVVTIDHEFAGKQITDSVQTDEEQGGMLVAQHLVGLGHRNIAFFTEFEKPARSWQFKRQKYFEFALHTLARDITYKSWHMKSDKDDDGVEVARGILSSPGRPTAIFADTDHVAIDVYNAAMDLGMRIPQDISVVGFSDLDFVRGMRPPLTTVRQNGLEVGRHAARLIQQRIEQKTNDQPHVVKVGCELMVRGSTAGQEKQLNGCEAGCVSADPAKTM